jgi:hypothetical protein
LGITLLNVKYFIKLGFSSILPAFFGRQWQLGGDLLVAVPFIDQLRHMMLLYLLYLFIASHHHKVALPFKSFY